MKRRDLHCNQRVALLARKTQKKSFFFPSLSLSGKKERTRPAAASSGIRFEGRVWKGHARGGGGKIAAGSRDAGPHARTHAHVRSLSPRSRRAFERAKRDGAASHSVAAEKVLRVAARAKMTKFGPTP